jgi:hypothetical protein
LQVYPNPVSDQLILLPKSTEPGSGLLKITDSRGRMVEQRRIQWEPYQALNIPLPRLANGLYQLELQQNQQSAVSKIIILQED